MKYMAVRAKGIASILFFLFLLTSFIPGLASANEAYFDGGTFTFVTQSKKATSSVRYLTVGWYIHMYDTCTTEDYTGECDPTSQKAGEHFKLEGGHIIDERITDTQVITTFQWTKEEVLAAIGEAKAEKAIKQGMTLYASAIMVSVDGPRENPHVRKGPFHTLSGIVKAENWAKPSDLRQYFDVQIVFEGDPEGYPVNKILYLSDGTKVDETLVGKFPAGHEILESFPEEVEYRQQTYEIYLSYLSPVLRPEERNFVQEKDKGDTKVLTRNFTVYVGGTNMVAMYRLKNDACESDPNADGCGPPPCEDGNCGGGGGGNAVCTGPVKGTVQRAQVMDPEATGVMQADPRGAERFDVLKGIPTSESLYVNASSKAYLYKNEFAEMSGTCKYPIQVTKTYTLKWTERVPGPPDSDGNPTTITVPRSDTQTVTKNYMIERRYRYWVIDNLEVYGIQKATFNNYALPSGTVTVQPAGYAPPNVSATHTDALESHITHPVYSDVTLPGQTINGGSSRPSVPDEDWTGEAEQAIGKIRVKNDSLLFNGTTVMDNRTVEEQAPAPGQIPSPPLIGPDVLYGKGYLIEPSKTNKANQPSSGTIDYSLVKGINGGENQSFPIHGLNPVTVHTPVVNYSSVSDDRAHNQKTTPSAGRSALILDRPFIVTIPTEGQHRNIPGYGNRDYAKYTKEKQVWFPFDVYSGDKSKFYPKETWISIPVSQETTTFFLPVWVDEGNYDVLFRTFAENSPQTGFGTEMNANLNVSNHVATQVVPVEVIGRLYDFRITDIADYNWETVFRTQKGGAAPTGNAYWVGTKDIDGSPRGNQPPFVLPVRQGSHPDPGKKNVAVKTGYHVKFEVKTKGNMFEAGDGIRITPKFYFVDRQGGNRQEVELYYHSGNKRFIRIGSADDVERRYVTLDERLRNVPRQELINTASSLWSLTGAGGNKQAYIDQYLKNTKKSTYVGGYDIMLLPPPLRTFIGSMNVPSGVDAARANASVQRWYGEYSLPAAVYVVPKGTNLAEYGRTHRLDDQSPIFLRDGYIIVNFNIETIRNKDLDHPHLQYIYGPLNNQWQMEGFKRSFTDPFGVTFQLKDGDIVFYHANLSSYDDFGTGGTH